MAEFPTASNHQELEHGDRLMPNFGADGLLTCVVVDAHDKAVLMLAHMNAEALARTLETREVHFFSRSRKALWKKGETSGNVLQLRRLMVDCDQDALVAEVDVAGDGNVCHTGARACFYREVGLPGEGSSDLADVKLSRSDSPTDSGSLP